MSKTAAKDAYKTKKKVRSHDPMLKSPQKPFLFRAGDWLGRRSRLQRAFIAGLIAISITVAVALILYSIADNYTAIDLTQAASLALIVLTIFGFILYWVGWNVLIGFGDTVMNPGPAAVIWVSMGLLVILVEIIVAAILAIQALGQT